MCKSLLFFKKNYALAAAMNFNTFLHQKQLIRQPR